MFKQILGAILFLIIMLYAAYFAFSADGCQVYTLGDNVVQCCTYGNYTNCSSL